MRGFEFRGNTDMDFGSRGEEVEEMFDPICKAAMEQP